LIRKYGGTGIERCPVGVQIQPAQANIDCHRPDCGNKFAVARDQAERMSLFPRRSRHRARPAPALNKQRAVLRRVTLLQRLRFDESDELDRAFHDFPDRASAGADRRYRRGQSSVCGRVTANWTALWRRRLAACLQHEVAVAYLLRF
jgi:hypothetical protein